MSLAANPIPPKYCRYISSGKSSSLKVPSVRFTHNIFPGAAKTFRDIETNVKIVIITTGEFPGDGLPKPVAFPNPEGQTVEEGNVRVITLEKLIELKLASGISAPGRMRDLADVQDLIISLKLPLELMTELDESVRPEYQRIWEAANKDSRR